MFETSPEVIKVGAAATSGAIVSLKWFKGTWVETVFMLFAGSVTGFYCGPLLANYLHFADAAGGFGFLIGVFGVLGLTKVYDIITDVNPKDIANAIVDKIKK